MKVIIAGSRTLTDPELVGSIMSKCPHLEVTEVVSGMARGIDFLGYEWAKFHGIPCKEMPANWNPNGGFDPEAGFKRNQDMADYADALVAIWDGKSNGTRDMIKRARKAGLNVDIFIVNPDDQTPPPSLLDFM